MSREMSWCPKCGAEYEGGVFSCADCGAELEAERPTSAPVVREQKDWVLLIPVPLYQAQMLVSLLREAEIPTLIDSEQAHSVMPVQFGGAIGVRLLVQSDRLEEARALLKRRQPSSAAEAPTPTGAASETPVTSADPGTTREGKSPVGEELVAVACSCGRTLEVARASEIECPWCGKKVDPAVAPPATKEISAPVKPRKRRPSIFLPAASAILLLAVFITFHTWEKVKPARPSRARAPASSRIDFESILQRGLRIPDTDLPALDPGKILAELGSGSSKVPLSNSLDELISAWLRERTEIDPDWALELGLADTPRITRYGPEAIKAHVRLNALALKRLRELGVGTLDGRLMERMFEYTLHRYLMYGAHDPDPMDAVRGVMSTYDLLKRNPSAARERLRQVPQVVKEVMAGLRRPSRLRIEAALYAIDRVEDIIREEPQAVRALQEYGRFLKTVHTDSAQDVSMDPRLVNWRFSSFEFTGRPASVIIREMAEEARINEADYDAIGEPPVMTFPEALDRLRAGVENAKRFTLENSIVDLPRDVTVEVMEAPGHLVSEHAEAFYYAPEFSASPRPRLMLARRELRTLPGFFMRAATHETYPGHHVHDLVARERASMAQRLYPSVWLTEGWAVYCERLAMRSLLAKDEREQAYWRLDRAGWARTAILAVCYLCCAVTEDEAIDYLVSNMGYERKAARRFVGEASLHSVSYVMGEREILRLRETIETRLGSRFSARDFHNRLLTFGHTPVALIREALSRD